MRYGIVPTGKGVALISVLGTIPHTMKPL